MTVSLPARVLRLIGEQAGSPIPVAVDLNDELSADLGLDSLAMIMVLVELEDAFGVALDEGEDFRTAADLVRAVEARVADKCEGIQ